MDELTLDGKNYLSSKRAAKVTGYAKDYVGQLCREGRISARLVGRNWYVLEESILEHRFGAEGKEQKPAPEPAVEAKTAWEPALYSVEEPQSVPTLAPKPREALPSSQAVLEDMQSAWQEWFQAKQKEEKMLPDASEMLLEAPDPVVVPEPMPTVALEREAEPIAIHIERPEHEEHPHPIERQVEAPEPVPVSRSSVAAPMAPMRGAKLAKRSRRRQGSGALMRALFLSVAGLAIAVTVVGSGIADTYLGNSLTSPLTNFIGGVNEISK
jgi:hypothetical protein